MAYSKKVVNEAKKLYTVEGLSFEKIAKKLNIAKFNTVLDWAKRDNWKQKRLEIGQKSDILAQEMIVNELAIDKAKITTENIRQLEELKVIPLAANRFSIKEFIDPVTNEFREDAFNNPRFAPGINLIRMLNPLGINVITALDRIVNNKTEIDINANINIKAAGLIKNLIADLRPTSPES